MGEERSRLTGRRGISEVAGLVLLFGLVIVGAAIVILTGSAVQEGVTEQTRVDAATKSMQEVDAELSSLSQEGSSKVVSLEPAPREGETVSVVRGDELQITIEGDASGSVTCTETVSLDALEYLGAAEDTTLVYQAGAVWKRTDGAAVMVSPPGIGYREGTLQFSLVKLTSGVSGSSGFSAERVADASKQRSAAVHEELFEHDACKRPNTVRLEFVTRYPDVWERFLTDEMPSGTVSRPATDTVLVEIDDSLLAREADDDRNTVVDFTNTPPSAGGPNDGHVLPGDDGVEVDKGISNTYDASLEYVTARLGEENVTTTYGTDTVSTWHWETRDVDWVQNNWDNSTVTIEHRYWDNESSTVEDSDGELGGTPLDVEFVIDESGSMGQPCTSSDDCTQRIDYATSAARSFVGSMPSAKARAGVVGYYDDPSTPTKDTTLYQSLTGSKGVINASIDGLDSRPGATTPIGEGLNKALNDIESNSDTDHERVVILLSDGQNNEHDGITCGWLTDCSLHPNNQADRAADMTNVTIYTVGVGNDVNQGLMQSIAAKTGGSYYPVDDAENIEDAFDSIYREVTNSSETVVDPDVDREVIEVPVSNLDSVAFDDTVRVRNYTTTTVTNYSDATTSYAVVRKPVGVSYQVGTGPQQWAFVSGSGSGLDRAVSYADLFGTVGLDGVEGMTVPDGDSVVFGATAWDCAAGATTDTGTTVTNSSGTAFEVHRCTAETGGSSLTAQVYVDADPIPANPDRAWWQDPLADRLPNRYTDSGAFDLKSNQVVVVVTGPERTVGAVYEMGKSSETETEWVIDLDVDVVEVEAAGG